MAALTEKQAKFARTYVETGNACEAYRQAYAPRRMSPKAITVESTRLLQHPSVALVVGQLRADHRNRHDMTVDRLTEMLLEDRELARRTEAPSAAVSAVMGIAKLHGLIVDKAKADINLDVMATAREEADAFTRRIAGIAPRIGTGEGAGDTEH